MERIEALIDNTYKTVDDKAIIYLYLINSILKDRDFKPYFYVELNKDKVDYEDIETIKDFLLKNDLLKFVEDFKVVKKKIFKKEKEILKIIATHPQKVPKLRKVKDCEIVKEIYEHDIPFAKRYLIDKDIIPMTYWDFENNKPVSREIPKLKAVSFDIEVYNRDTEPDPERDPILMASFWDENGGKVITYKEFDHPNIEVVENEKMLIKKIIETLKKYDIIYTYNGDNFDFPYLKGRSKLYNIKIELGRENEEVKIKRGGMEYRSYIPGRVHIDLYPISRRLLKLTKYTLEDVVYNLFGIKKLKISHKDIANYWINNDKTLIEYSLQDAKYTYKVGNYFFPLEVMFSRIVNQTPFEITRMTSGQMVEYLLMKNAFKENMIVPNKPDDEEYKRRLLTTYEGGYVKEPEKGIFEDIILMDFRSLYPSIIISYNISPDTLDCECCKDESEKILGHWFCKKREGLIPKTLRNLIERRINIKKKMKQLNKEDEEYKLLDYEQQSLKILANSILPDEYLTIIENDEKCKVVKIGEYIDRFIKRYRRKIRVRGNSRILNLSNIKSITLKTFSFNIESKESSINKVKALIRHKYSGKAYKIKLRSGRTIKITESHSLFKYENGRIVCVKGNEIKVGDLIVVPKKLKSANKEIYINIPKGLVDADEEEIKNIHIWKYKDKEFFIKLIKTIECIENKEFDKVFIDSLTYLNELNLITYKKYSKKHTKIDKITIKILNKKKFAIYKKYVETLLKYGNFRKKYLTISYLKIKDFILNLPDKEFEDCEIGAYSEKLDAILKLDEKLAKFLGVFVPRGVLSKIVQDDYIIYEVAVYKSIPEHQEKVLEIFREVFGSGSISKDKVRMEKKIVYLLLKYIFKFGDKGKDTKKRIPEELFLAKESVIRSFIEGFIIAKKNKFKEPLTFMAKDEEYLYQLMLLFNLVGIPTRFTPVKNKGYKLTVIPPNTRNYLFDKDLMLDKVKSIEEFEYNGYVYDLSVKENENFLVNNIYAHNSHYGYLAYPRARFYSKECAEIVTYLGRKYIQQTIEEAEKFGFKVIYADSVSGNTEIIIREKGEIKFVKIKDLFKKVEYKLGDKEYCTLQDVEALTLDDNGKLVWKKIPYIMRHLARKKMYRVWITNSWYIDVTEDHSLIGYLNTKFIKKVKKIGERFIEIKPREIGKTVKSLITLNGTLIKDSDFAINIGVKFWELIGLLIGEGSWRDYTNIAKYYLHLSAGVDRDEIVNKILEPLKKAGVITYYYVNRKGDVKILSKKLVKFMRVFKDENDRKIIPKFLYKLRRKYIEAFLRGFFSADGSVIIKRGYPEVMLTCINEELLKSIRKLLWLVGISHSIFKDSGTYSMYIFIKNKWLFAKRIGFLIERKQKKLIDHLKPNSRYKSTFFDFDLVNVKKVEEIDYNDYVYDIEVEETHRFFANGILVHNTDGFYAIWKEKISKDELIKKALEFVEYINSKLPGTMELEFEGYFKRGIFVTKKKYALIDENGKITIKGLEYIRRDWSNIAKITQKKVLEALLVEGNIEKAKKIIQDVIKNLREGKIKKEDLIIYTQLTKDPREYKTTAPHVEIAKKLMREGKKIKVGDIIGYIIVKGSKSISERAKLPEEVDIDDVDVNYYIDNQILPPVLRIMEAVGVSKNELKKEGSQLTLDKFILWNS